MAWFLKRLRDDRKGNALVIAAAALPLVLGSAGLASDTIQWALWKRQLQRAADSAAIAGVYAKIQGQEVDGAVSTDLDKNNQTGMGLVAGYPEVTHPANTSTYNNAVKVSLAVQKRLGFSSLFLSSVPVIKAEATAAGIETGEYCVVSLENTATTGITATGNTTMDLGCGMITNSTSLDAAVATGSSNVQASPIAAVGGIAASDNWGDDTQLLPFTLAQEDPFKDVHPTTEGCPGPNVNVNSNQTVTLDPGCYGNMTLNGNVTLNAGTYILDAGSLSIGAQATVVCTGGCTFVLTSRTASTNPGSIGNVTINGGAEVQLTAPSTGPYAGIMMYQDRRAQSGVSANQTNHLNGNSDSSFQGAFYFPSQETVFNGTAGMETDCVQIVARRVSFSGDSSITNTCPPGSGADSFKGRHVRLVA